MRIIKKQTLQNFWGKYPGAEQALMAWYQEARHANWEKPEDIKDKYGSASILADNRVVFNICGNKYRLIVKIMYKLGCIYIRFIGTHTEYEKINAEEI